MIGWSEILAALALFFGGGGLVGGIVAFLRAGSQNRSDLSADEARFRADLLQKIDKLEAAYIDLDKRHEASLQAIAKLEAENTSLHRELKELREANTRLSTQVQVLGESQRQEVLRAAEARRRVEVLEAENTALRAENATLRAQLAQSAMSVAGGVA